MMQFYIIHERHLQQRLPLFYLLQGNRLVPIVHGTTYTALRDVSPMLASRSGLDTSEDTMAVVATKIAELVAIWS